MLQDSYVFEAAVPQIVTRPAPTAVPAAAREDQVDPWRMAMESRQQLGVATGLTAALTRSTPEEAWELLVSVSRNANVKVRDVGRVVVQTYCGEVDAQDTILADRLRSHLPKGCRLLRPGFR